MTNHLKACWKQHPIAAPGKATRHWFHLVVEARYAPDYWMHLQAPANCTFGDLDALLRVVWLECCGHLSAFEFPVKRKLPRGATPRDTAAMVEALVQEARRSASDDDASDDALMDEPLASRLQPGVAFSHQYDFGTTTDWHCVSPANTPRPRFQAASSSWPATNRPPSRAPSAPNQPRDSASNATTMAAPRSAMLAPPSTTAMRKGLCP